MDKTCLLCHGPIVHGSKYKEDIQAQVRGFCCKADWDLWEYENKKLREAAN